MARPEGSGSRRMGNVYLGTIPDYAQEGARGVPLSGVIKGGPAEAAGLQGGDVVVGLAGQTLENIYDYVRALNGLKPGETIAVLGAGPIGLLTAAVARAGGAGEIYMTEPLAHRRQFALDYVADVVLNPDDTDVVAEIERLTDGAGRQEIGGANCQQQSIVPDHQHPIRFVDVETYRARSGSDALQPVGNARIARRRFGQVGLQLPGVIDDRRLDELRRQDAAVDQKCEPADPHPIEDQFHDQQCGYGHAGIAQRQLPAKLAEATQ